MGGGTNLILRIKEQGTRLTLQEHDDADDDDNDDENNIEHANSQCKKRNWGVTCWPQTN
jgi:hypothetical protein